MAHVVLFPLCVFISFVDNNGKLVGTFDENPVLNSMIYDVQFPDGAVKQYAANIIAENILYQVDSNGNTHKCWKE